MTFARVCTVIDIDLRLVHGAVLSYQTRQSSVGGSNKKCQSLSVVASFFSCLRSGYIFVTQPQDLAALFEAFRSEPLAQKLAWFLIVLIPLALIPSALWLADAVMRQRKADGRARAAARRRAAGRCGTRQGAGRRRKRGASSRAHRSRGRHRRGRAAACRSGARDANPAKPERDRRSANARRGTARAAAEAARAAAAGARQAAGRSNSCSASSTAARTIIDRALAEVASSDDCDRDRSPSEESDGIRPPRASALRRDRECRENRGRPEAGLCRSRRAGCALCRGRGRRGAPRQGTERRPRPARFGNRGVAENAARRSRNPRAGLRRRQEETRRQSRRPRSAIFQAGDAAP